MLRKVIDKDGKNWDTLLQYLTFVVREVPQASMGFSLFELLYGRQPRGILDMARETWESQINTSKNVVDHDCIPDRIINSIFSKSIDPMSAFNLFKQIGFITRCRSDIHFDS